MASAGAKQGGVSAQWNCVTCGFHNDLSEKWCAMCNSASPAMFADIWGDLGAPAKREATAAESEAAKPEEQEQQVANVPADLGQLFGWADASVGDEVENEEGEPEAKEAGPEEATTTPWQLAEGETRYIVYELPLNQLDVIDDPGEMLEHRLKQVSKAAELVQQRCGATMLATVESMDSCSPEAKQYVRDAFAESIEISYAEVLSAIEHDRPELWNELCELPRVIGVVIAPEFFWNAKQGGKWVPHANRTAHETIMEELIKLSFRYESLIIAPGTVLYHHHAIDDKNANEERCQAWAAAMCMDPGKVEIEPLSHLFPGVEDRTRCSIWGYANELLVASRSRLCHVHPKIFMSAVDCATSGGKVGLYAQPHLRTVFPSACYSVVPDGVQTELLLEICLDHNPAYAASEAAKTDGAGPRAGEFAERLAQEPAGGVADANAAAEHKVPDDEAPNAGKPHLVLMVSAAIGMDEDRFDSALEKQAGGRDGQWAIYHASTSSTHRQHVHWPDGERLRDDNDGAKIDGKFVELTTFRVSPGAPPEPDGGGGDGSAEPDGSPGASEPDGGSGSE